jgi:transcription elongation factor Elf1
MFGGPYNTGMSILEVTCPVCDEVLELTDADRAELSVGDAVVCDNCNAEMEVTANSGEDFELELLGILTTCPNCGEEFDVTEEMTQAGDTVTCPHCQALIELEFEEGPEGA